MCHSILLSCSSIFTSTQTTLLKILDSKIHVSSSSSSIPLSHQLPSSTIRGLARIFNDASSRAVQLMRQLPPATPSASREPDEAPMDEPTSSSVEDTANLYTGLVLLLQCFGYLSLEEAETETEVRQALTEEGILSSCCGNSLPYFRHRKPHVVLVSRYFCLFTQFSPACPS